VLTLNIQKRHVIGHNLGIADAMFTEHAADARLGETVPLVGEDILQFADICKMTVDHIDAWLASGALPPSRDVPPVKPIIAPPAKEPATLRVGKLGKLAVRIALWVAERSEKGLGDFIAEEELTKAFPDSSMDELAFAVAELAKDGYLRTSAVISKRIPRIRVAAELFITFDPHAIKTDPASDVVTLVDLALARSNTVGVEELHAATGWPLRRFNPAFAYMVSQIDGRRVLAGGTNDYPARGFFLMDEDRVDLKRFADRLRG
jgi:hypothetical protein